MRVIFFYKVSSFSLGVEYAHITSCMVFSLIKCLLKRQNMADACVIDAECKAKERFFFFCLKWRMI